MPIIRGTPKRGVKITHVVKSLMSYSLQTSVPRTIVVWFRGTLSLGVKILEVRRKFYRHRAGAPPTIGRFFLGRPSRGATIIDVVCGKSNRNKSRCSPNGWTANSGNAVQRREDNRRYGWTAFQQNWSMVFPGLSDQPFGEHRPETRKRSMVEVKKAVQQNRTAVFPECLDERFGERRPEARRLSMV